MAKEAAREQEAMAQGQAEIWACRLAYAESMALRCALELRIPAIINSHGHPITISQIIDTINKNSPNHLPPDANYLSRIMRLLVRKRIFTSEPSNEAGQDFLYGLTPASKWLLEDGELSLGPFVAMETHPQLIAPWHYLSKCVQDGGEPFRVAHGTDMWGFASLDPDFNKFFNAAMACSAKIIVRTVLERYKEGFEGVATLVDVGGGTGMLIREVVDAHPHVKGILFDLPHVVATAPDHPNVVKVAGNMFEEVPRADAVIMKWVMHDWTDEDCIRILKNCRKAMPEKGGKLIIVDLVLQPEGDGLFDYAGILFDVLMIAHTSGGKERTEAEWKHVLGGAGFPTFKIIQIPTLPSIIEAYPF